MRSREPCRLAVFKKYRNKLTGQLKKEKNMLLQQTFFFFDMPKKRPAKVSKIIIQVLKRQNIKYGITKLTIENKKLSGVFLADTLIRIS